jgi:hypothetical protein
VPLAIGIVVMTVGCGGQRPSSTAGLASGSPSPDLVTTNYVALVHNYWIQYKSAEGDLDHVDGTSDTPYRSQDAGRACFGFLSPRGAQDISLVDPKTCGTLAAAIVAVHEKFVSDLSTTPAPHKFAAEDQAFKTQLPKAIVDVKAMIAASATGDKQSVADATASYVSAMIPVVTDALNGVDPSVVHN